MQTPTIQITEADLKKLNTLLNDPTQCRPEEKSCREALARELQRAKVLPSEEISPDVITLHSRAKLTDLASNEELELTIVMPEEADASSGRISILAPLGTAMLGYSKGDTFTWTMPGGESRFRVDEVVFQPEAIQRTATS